VERGILNPKLCSLSWLERQGKTSTEFAANLASRKYN